MAFGCRVGDVRGAERGFSSHIFQLKSVKISLSAPQCFPFIVLLLCSLLFPSPLLLFPIKTEENVSSEALAKSQNKNLFLVLLHLCTFTRLSSWFLSPFHQDQNCPDLSGNANSSSSLWGEEVYEWLFLHFWSKSLVKGQILFISPAFCR